MTMFRFCATVLIFGIVLTTCFADEEDTGDEKKLSMDDVKNKFEDALGDPMKGMGDFFKNVAEGAKIRAESGVETMKEFAAAAQEKSQAGMEVAKGFAAGMDEQFKKMKDSVEENGEKWKGAFTSAAEKSKDEFQTAASKISEHAKEASDAMFNLFKFK